MFSPEISTDSVTVLFCAFIILSKRMFFRYVNAGGKTIKAGRSEHKNELVWPLRGASGSQGRRESRSRRTCNWGRLMRLARIYYYFILNLDNW